jgi:sugar O-acyltransferase (sialic acid O-acetyltransferase NeuD family)
LTGDFPSASKSRRRKLIVKKILIVGAGGFGREVYNWILDSREKYPDWEVKGFLDDNKEALKKYKYDIPVVESIRDYHPKENEFLVIGIGVPKIKKTVVESLLARGAHFLSLIHRSSIVGANVALGKGCVLCPNSVLTCDINLGDFVTVNCFSDAGHDVSIGSFTTLSCHVDITGFAKIGNAVLLGSKASVLPGVSVEDYATIGAGSVVVHKVKKGNTVFGNPAKVIFEPQKDQKE